MSNTTAPNPEDKILARVKKMMALANCQGATEHERDTAMGQAYRLLAKHNLSMMEVEAHGQEAPDPRDNYKQVGWSQLWAKSACHVIADLFFCKYYYGQKINATKCVHHFVGKESNATTAMLMSEYVVVSIMKEGRSRGWENLGPQMRSFALGCVAKLYDRVEEMKKQMQDESTPGTALALVNMYDAESKANIALLPKLKAAGKGKAADYDAYHQGQQFGSTLNLNQQLTSTRQTTKAIK